MGVDRLLSILLIISNKGTVTGQELADHFEVSLRTIYRDIDKIGQAGVPIASTGGKGGGYYIMDNYNLDNLYFKKEEVQTLSAVMNSINIVFGKKQQFNDVLLKFENAYKKGASFEEPFRIDMSHFSMEEELKAYLFLIHQGIGDSRLLVFDYINRNMEYLERIVEPIQITFSHGQWYVTAFCRKRNGLRKFKIVRMRDLKIGGHFTKREIRQEDIERIFSESYDQNSIKVVFKFTNKIGEQLTEYFLKECIRKTEDGHFIVEDSLPYEEGLLKFILGFGKECEVIEPIYLREEIEDYLKKMLEKYSG